MSIRGFAPGRLCSTPRGPWSALTNRRKGDPSRGFAMQNMRCRFGTVRTRAGTSAVFASTGKVTGMSNWITPAGENLVLYQDGATIKSYDQFTAASATLISAGLTSNRAPVFSPFNVWNYICGFDTAGNGTIQVQIFDGTNVDTAFRGPIDITGWTTADGGTGVCTQGRHFFGFVYQNRTGYSGVPVTGIDFQITDTASATATVSSTTNASPDVLTLSAAVFNNGDVVVGSGSTGDTAINGTFLIANVAGSTVQLTDMNGNPIAGNGAYTGGCTLTGADVVTAPGNNVQTGDIVNIAGVFGDTAVNGLNLTATVITPGSTFTLTDGNGNQIVSNGAYFGGGVLTNLIQINLTAGNRLVDISVSLPALTDAGLSANGEIEATLFLIGTRADNPALWYFLGSYDQTGQVGEGPVPLNSATTMNFIFNLSDEDIAASLAGDTAQNNFLLLSQDDDGNGPFSPNFVAAYGTRMCYGAGTTLYVSDEDNPQQIAADTNAVMMQNQRAIGFAFPLPGNTGLFLTGDRWTGYVTDNGDSPSTWSPPVNVSTTLGTQWPNCVCADTGGPWVWVVTEAGPYLFDGNYALNPLTYLVSGYTETGAPMGWKRVNWNAAYAIKVVDDVQTLKCYIAVPLDGATEPNYQFVIDYRLGMGFDQVDISLDVFTPQFYSSIAVIKEQATGLTNVWMGPAAAGNITRFDVTTHNDQGIAIHGLWTSGLVRGQNIISTMVRVGAMDVWARGNAPLDSNGLPTLTITLFGPDGQVQVPIQILTTQGVYAALVEQPGLTYMSKFDVNQIEDYYVQFETNAVDSWLELSAFRSYERQDLFNR